MLECVECVESGVGDVVLGKVCYLSWLRWWIVLVVLCVDKFRFRGILCDCLVFCVFGMKSVVLVLLCLCRVGWSCLCILVFFFVMLFSWLLVRCLVLSVGVVLMVGYRLCRWCG